MKKLLMILAVTTGVFAIDYSSYIQPYIDVSVNEAKTEVQLYIDNEVKLYRETVTDNLAVVASISSIEFNPNYKGLSVGVGANAAHSNGYTGKGYAVGAQYGLDNCAINIKGAMANSDNYIVGAGFTIGL